MEREYSAIGRALPLTVLLFATLGVLVSGFQPAEAEESTSKESLPESQESLPDRFMIRGGWGYVFNADTVLGINGASGIGTTVDLSSVLKTKREDELWRIDSLYRFNPKHSMGFSYYDVNRTGLAQLTRSVAVGDTTYGVGSQMTTNLDIGLYRFFYNYSFHHDDKVELAASVGMYFADIRASFTGSFACTGSPNCTGAPQAVLAENGKLFAPLPTLGLLVNYHFTPRLLGQARFDWFYVEFSQFKGSMTEMYLGLEYRLFKHVAVGAAFNRLNVSLNYNPDASTGWAIRNDWNMLYMFGSLYF
jgi:hypothetical protein